MTKNCKECESDIMDKYSDIAIKYDRAQEQIKLLTECMDTKEKLNDFYRQEIEELKVKLAY
jgi:hypothetical protein